MKRKLVNKITDKEYLERYDEIQHDVQVNKQYYQIISETGHIKILSPTDEEGNPLRDNKGNLR